MANTFKNKIAHLLDWLNRGYVVVQILVSLGLGTLVEAIFKSYTDISSVWITPLWLFSGALFLGLLLLLGNKIFRRPEGQRTTIQNASNALVNPSINFDAKAFFQQSYNSTLQSEIESNIRVVAAQTQPNDHEGFYVRLVSVGVIAYVYDIIWAYIYRSQVLLLTELNRRMLPLSEVKLYYDKAVSENIAIYADYSFDQWLSFMKAQLLILEHPSHMVEITIRGRDFLKYLVHFGRSADDRRY